MIRFYSFSLVGSNFLCSFASVIQLFVLGEGQLLLSILPLILFASVLELLVVHSNVLIIDAQRYPFGGSIIKM